MTSSFLTKGDIHPTPQTYLWLDEFVDCPYYVDKKKKIIVTNGKNGPTTHAFCWRYHKYGLARAMSKMDEQKDNKTATF